MKCLTTYKRQNTDTVNGEILVIRHMYTTFDAQEMEVFENIVRATIGSGVVTEVEPQESEE